MALPLAAAAVVVGRGVVSGAAAKAAEDVVKHTPLPETVKKVVPAVVSAVVGHKLGG